MAAYTIDAKTYRSPNYDNRPAGTDIHAIIMHTCEGSPPGNEQQSSIPWLCNPSSEVSAHYYVTRESVIYQLVDESKRAWHAGVSLLNGVWYCNDYSIGIELEHKRGAPPYPRAQYDALTWLCKRLIASYAVPRSDIATHRLVASNAGRTDRSDPTDWTDTQFNTWADTLYAPSDPLKARTLNGPPNTPAIWCSVGAYTFYNGRGGLPFCGYPLRDEFLSTSTNGAPCSVLRCERVVIKASGGYGIEQALLDEAIRLGWI